MNCSCFWCMCILRQNNKWIAGGKKMKPLYSACFVEEHFLACLFPICIKITLKSTNLFVQPLEMQNLILSTCGKCPFKQCIIFLPVLSSEKDLGYIGQIHILMAKCYFFVWTGWHGRGWDLVDRDKTNPADAFMTMIQKQGKYRKLISSPLFFCSRFAF